MHAYASQQVQHADSHLVSKLVEEQPQFNSALELPMGSLVPNGSNDILLAIMLQLSRTPSLQVKNGLPLSATAPGPSQLKDLPDPCASALSIPKASCTGSL